MRYSRKKQVICQSNVICSVLHQNDNSETRAAVKAASRETGAVNHVTRTTATCARSEEDTESGKYGNFSATS